MNIDFCFTEIPDKSKKIAELQDKLNITPRETLFVGDDINDLVVKPFISLLVAPNDSNYFYKSKADLVLKSKGGKGAVRELAERIIKSLNLLDSFDLEWKEKMIKIERFNFFSFKNLKFKYEQSYTYIWPMRY